MSIAEHIYDAEVVLPHARKLEGNSYESYQSQLSEDEHLFLIFVNRLPGFPRMASWVHSEDVYVLSCALMKSNKELYGLEPWQGFYAVDRGSIAGLTYLESSTPDFVLAMARRSLKE